MVHPLILYIKEENNYLVKPNKKLEDFRKYVRQNPEYNLKKAPLRLLNQQDFINNKMENLQLKVVVQRKKSGIPKKLPELEPKVSPSKDLDTLINILKKAKK